MVKIENMVIECPDGKLLKPKFSPPIITNDLFPKYSAGRGILKHSFKTLENIPVSNKVKNNDFQSLGDDLINIVRQLKTTNASPN